MSIWDDPALAYEDSDEVLEASLSETSLDDHAELVGAYRRLDAHIRELTEERDAVRRQLEKLLDDAQVGTLAGRPVVTWRWSRPSVGVDAERLRRELPDVFAAYSKVHRRRRPFIVYSPEP